VVARSSLLHGMGSLLLAGIFILILSCSLRAQQLTEYVQVDSLTVGDTFTYTLTLSKDREYDDIIFPDSAAFANPFELRSQERHRVSDFKDSLIYHLQFFGTEDHTIPPLEVRLINEADTTVLQTNPVPIAFKTVLQSEEEEFRPLKPIFNFAAAWWPYILAFLLLLAAGGYLYYLYKEKGLEPSEPEVQQEYSPTPFQDPLNRLKNILSQLKGYSLTSENDFKVFYINLGDAIREYFEDLYHIPALESTSREILYELERRSVDEELIEKTKEVLREADMVKFAKFTPTEAQAKKALQKADAFLKRAKEVDKPRIDHLRRKHHQENERKRREFKEAQAEQKAEAES